MCKCSVVVFPQYRHPLIPRSSSSWSGKSARSIVKQLYLAPYVYYIWKEKNCMIFRNSSCPLL
ncbi:hypothetical protein ACE6H2_005515 [Prunus campanulata]